MSTDLPAPVSTPWQPRLEAEVIADQVQGIAAWHEARRVAESAGAEAAGGLMSREMRLDLDRRLEVLRRQHEAIVQRTEEQLADSGRVRPAAGPPRAVVAHRNAWFRDKVIDGLVSSGIEVVGRLENGADAVGLAVAEQPDLLLVEDKLVMISGVEVIRQVRTFAPRTLIAAHMSYDDGVTAALAAGATAAFSRRTGPVDVARELSALLTP